MSAMANAAENGDPVHEHAPGAACSPSCPINHPTPHSATDLVQLRAQRIAFPEDPLPADIVFTCDGCLSAPECEWVFDPYNTDGDCLAEK